MLDQAVAALTINVYLTRRTSATTYRLLNQHIPRKDQ